MNRIEQFLSKRMSRRDALRMTLDASLTVAAGVTGGMIVNYGKLEYNRVHNAGRIAYARSELIKDNNQNYAISRTDTGFIRSVNVSAAPLPKATPTPEELNKETKLKEQISTLTEKQKQLEEPIEEARDRLAYSSTITLGVGVINLLSRESDTDQ